jgi:tRNA (Thr-GGU) A37 N-methylase
MHAPKNLLLALASQVLEIAGSAQLRVDPLEAIDGTPVLDIEPVLSGAGEV